MTVKAPKLPLTPEERRQLRAAGIRLADFARLDVQALAQRLGWAESRLRRLGSLARFQQLPDVGPATAGDFVLLGFHDPTELVGQDAGELFRRLQRLTHSAQDPCCEDVFACAIHHVTHGPDPERRWWDWSARRQGQGS